MCGSVALAPSRISIVRRHRSAGRGGRPEQCGDTGRPEPMLPARNGPRCWRGHSCSRPFPAWKPTPARATATRAASPVVSPPFSTSTVITQVAGKAAVMGPRRAGPGVKGALDDRRDVSGIDHVGVLPVDRGEALDRQHVEDQVAAGQAAHLGGEVEQVPPRIGDDVLQSDGKQGVQLNQVAGARPRPAVGRSLGPKEYLLAMGTNIQVAVGQAVTLAHERQRLGRVQVLVSGGEIGAGVHVVDRMPEADLHPAEHPRELVEPRPC